MAPLEVHNLQLQRREWLLRWSITSYGLLGRRPCQLLLESHVSTTVPRWNAGCTAAVACRIAVARLGRSGLVLGWAVRHLFLSVAVVIERDDLRAWFTESEALPGWLGISCASVAGMVFVLSRGVFRGADMWLGIRLPLEEVADFPLSHRRLRRWRHHYRSCVHRDETSALQHQQF